VCLLLQAPTLKWLPGWGWAVLAQRPKEQCSSCQDSSSARGSSSALAGAATDAARVADNRPSPEAGSSRSRSARQIDPHREAAFKPGEGEG